MMKAKSLYRVSFLNCCYAHSPTYPSLLVTPNQVTDQTLLNTMHFRSRGRVAAVSWISKSTGLCISRCSQPGKGFGLTRDQYDEELLEKLAHVGNGKFLMVFDARPKLSAIGNRLTGKGFESSRAYPFSKTYYCNIENIHVVRDSFDLMVKAALAYK